MVFNVLYFWYPRQDYYYSTTLEIGEAKKEVKMIESSKLLC